MTYHTIGQILRGGLMQNRKGKPYKDKAAILRIVRLLPHSKIQTTWGEGYAISEDEIRKHNGNISAQPIPKS